MIEMLQAKTKAAEEAIAKAEAEQKRRAEEREQKQRAERSKTGPTPQPLLPVIEQVFTLDDQDRACPSCGGELRPMAGQFEESELIDVIQSATSSCR